MTETTSQSQVNPYCPVHSTHLSTNPEVCLCDGKMWLVKCTLDMIVSSEVAKTEEEAKKYAWKLMNRMGSQYLEETAEVDGVWAESAALHWLDDDLNVAERISAE